LSGCGSGLRSSASPFIPRNAAHCYAGGNLKPGYQNAGRSSHKLRQCPSPFAMAMTPATFAAINANRRRRSVCGVCEGYCCRTVGMHVLYARLGTCPAGGAALATLTLVGLAGRPSGSYQDLTQSWSLCYRLVQCIWQHLFRLLPSVRWACGRTNESRSGARAARCDGRRHSALRRCGGCARDCAACLSRRRRTVVGYGMLCVCW